MNVDAVQLQRVLANLIENALKFAPSSSRVHVQITATRQEAIVRVVDQGPGVPALLTPRTRQNCVVAARPPVE